MSVIEDVWARAGDRRACQMASAAPRLIRGAVHAGCDHGRDRGVGFLFFLVMLRVGSECR